jgi:hypothetical protein
MGLFKTWCDADEEEEACKRYWSFCERRVVDEIRNRSLGRSDRTTTVLSGSPTTYRALATSAPRSS